MIWEGLHTCIPRSRYRCSWTSSQSNCRFPGSDFSVYSQPPTADVLSSKPKCRIPQHVQKGIFPIITSGIDKPSNSQYTSDNLEASKAVMIGLKRAEFVRKNAIGIEF